MHGESTLKLPTDEKRKGVFCMRKKITILLLVFAVSSSMLAREWKDLISTNDNNISCEDVVKFFVAKIGSMSYAHACVCYKIETNGVQYDCEVKELEDGYRTSDGKYVYGKNLLLVFRNFVIYVANYSDPTSFTFEDARYHTFDCNTYWGAQQYFGSMAQAITGAIMQGRVMVKKFGQSYTADEEIGIEALEILARVSQR